MKEDTRINILIVVLLILKYSLLFYAAYWITERVVEQGVKNIIHNVWYGVQLNDEGEKP
jgi:hypothetical protein